MKQELKNNNKNFIVKYAKSFCYAMSGIWYAIKYERNMIVIFFAGVIASLLGFYFKIDKSEWVFCILMIAMIMTTEMVNTAIEKTVDLVTEDYHELAKVAKDTAAGATLILCIVAFIGAIIIFGPKIVGLF